MDPVGGNEADTILIFAATRAFDLNNATNRDIHRLT